MLAFILTALIITAVVLFFMVRPLLNKTHADQALQRQQQNIHFARERLQELEQQFQANTISEHEYQSLKLELEASLAEDMTDLDGDLAQSSSTSNAVLITLLCCLVPFFALGLYLITGNPAAINNAIAIPQAQATQNSGANPTTNVSQQGIEEMVSSLEERLKSQPNDIKGWTILSRTYQQMGRFEDAIRALKHLTTIQPNNPETYAQLADASAFANGGKLAGEPQQYIKQALQLDPRQPQALWLAGLSAVQTGDNNKAVEYWEMLAPLLSGSPDQQQQLLEIINQTKSEANGQAPNMVANNKAIESKPSNDNQNDKQNIEGLRVSISIAPSIANNINPNDTVFVIAKAKNGPPAPLAVRRIRAADLPTSLVLTDNDAMMSAQFKISIFPEIVLTARVSKSGRPMATAGDYQSIAVNTSNTSQQNHKLVISQLIQ